MTPTPGPPAGTVPPPGRAPLPAPNAAALLRANATDPDRAGRPAIRYEDRVFTHADLYRESCRVANLLRARLDPGRPPHVGVLCDNRPEYLFCFGGAALAGAAVVGLNHTRRGVHLLRDLRHTDCGLVVTEPRHLPLLEPVWDDLPPVLVVGDTWEAALAEVAADDPGADVEVDRLWALVFTSGTSDAPKAVICSQRRLLVSGNRMAMILGIGPDDVGYLCMPLFHSNAIVVGWMPSIVRGASVAVVPRFSASRWLDDVRRYGVTWFGYTGKPLAYILATPEQPDDAENPLRVAFGNEGSPGVVEAFARRFGVHVIDAYGATEGGIAVNRDAPARPGALGRAGPEIRIVDEEGREKPRARIDADGRLSNAHECVGEIVNTAGAGPFEGYYNNPEATARVTRFGWYWSGDLGYLDEDGYLYFAGRTADWLRVDGENFAAAPIEEALRRHPDVILAAVYGVPDPQAGDAVMAGLVLAEGAVFDGAAFAAWLDAQPDLGPKWRPRYVRILREPPTTGTFKVVKRTLVHEKWRRDRCGGDAVWVRDRDAPAYRPFTDADERALREAFIAHGRIRDWDL